MARKTRHVVPNSDGGWDSKKVELKELPNILTPKKRQNNTVENCLVTKSQN